MVLGAAAAELAPLLAMATAAIAPLIAVATRQAPRARIAAIAALVLSGALLLRPVLALQPTTRAGVAAIAAVRTAEAGGGAGAVTPVFGGRTTSYSFVDAIRGLPPSTGVTERRIGYAAPGGVPLELRLFCGPAPEPRPTVVVIYGGAWQAGTPAQAEGTTRYLAHLGYTVAAIDYRHAPAHRHPAQIEDVRRSLTLLPRFRRRLGDRHDTCSAARPLVRRAPRPACRLFRRLGRACRASGEGSGRVLRARQPRRGLR